MKRNLASEVSAYAGKVCAAGLDMHVEQVEDDPMREVSEAAVVDHEALASIDHLQEFRWSREYHRL